MSSRQARRERREAERKAKKAEMKRLKAAAAGLLSDLEPGFVSHESLVAEAETGPGFVSYAAPIRTARQEINRANAQHSTGPRTANGKLASSRNSLKHGLASGELVIPGEDPAAFEELLANLLEDHQPANATEELLVRQMAQCFWLSQRAIRLQTECFTAGGVQEKRLALFLRYQATYDRTLYKCLNELRRLKREREQASGFVSQLPETVAPPTASAAGFVSHISDPTPLSTPNLHCQPAATESPLVLKHAA